MRWPVAAPYRDRFGRPGSVEMRKLMAWVAEQIAEDAGALEGLGTPHDQSNCLRGRFAAWRKIRCLADDREIKVDGQSV